MTSELTESVVAHSVERLVGPDPPHDGRDWECQCARCGSTLEWELCSACDGEGITGPGELYEQDPLWYDPGDMKPCGECGGQGGHYWCDTKECPTNEGYKLIPAPQAPNTELTDRRGAGSVK